MTGRRRSLGRVVHTLAGVMTIVRASALGLAANANAIDPALLVADYDPAVGGVLNKHGFNLLWTGLATITGAVLIWLSTMTAIWVTAMIRGRADVGYLLFVDLKGHMSFFPGTVKILISATAILLSFWA